MTKELNELEQYENDRTIDDNTQRLKKLGFKSFDELLDKIESLREKLGINDKSEKDEGEDKWNLINIDDADLDDEQRKLKRIQKMQKSSYLKRMEKRIKIEAEKQRLEKLKQDDPQGYLNDLYK